MGLFSFLKGSGEKNIDPAAENSAKATSLTNTINANSLNVTALNVAVDEETAKIWGVAEDQSTREKVVLLTGNTQGIAEVEDNMTTAVPEPEAKMHTVKSGESLSLIAKNYYGNAMKYNAIFEANKPMLSNPDKIYPGQVLRIPNL